MKKIWDDIFSKESPVWGLKASDSAKYAVKLFVQSGIKQILIPGVGYGRNAQLFLENGIQVTGIEISAKAIEHARKLGYTFQIHQGSVCDMPFDSVQYNGIFCYAVLHLLNKTERAKFLNACYQQLAPNGLMIFTVISENADKPGARKMISDNRFLLENGLKVYYYNKESIEKEFSKFGMVDYWEIDEPIYFMPKEKPIKSYIITCKKNEYDT